MTQDVYKSTFRYQPKRLPENESTWSISQVVYTLACQKDGCHGINRGFLRLFLKGGHTI